MSVALLLKLCVCALRGAAVPARDGTSSPLACAVQDMEGRRRRRSATAAVISSAVAMLLVVFLARSSRPEVTPVQTVNTRLEAQDAAHVM